MKKPGRLARIDLLLMDSPSVRPSFAAVSAVALIAASLAATSCGTDDYPGPDGNIFLNRRAPKYGHGGTDSPKYGDTGRRPVDADAEGRVGRRNKTEFAREDREEKPDDTSSDDSKPDDSRPGSDSSSGTAEKPSSDEKPVAEEKPSTDSKPAAKKEEGSNLPFGVPVPGKEGLVYSPYFSGGYVDVKGMPPGEKVRCPYTKKIFRVP